MNLLTAPIKTNLIISEIDLIDDSSLKRFGIDKNSIVTIVKRIQKTGVVLGLKTRRIAIDEMCASNIKVNLKEK
jgi:Fe2+ transport system protein FeoA